MDLSIRSADEAATVGRGLRLLESFQRRSATLPDSQVIGRSESPTLGPYNARSGISKDDARKDDRTGTSANRSRSSNKQGDHSAQSTTSGDPTTVLKEVWSKEQSPALSDAAIEATRRLGREHIIIRALTLIRLSAIRTLLNEVMEDFDSQPTLMPQNSSILPDAASRQTLKKSWQGVEEVVCKLLDCRLEKVMNLVTSASDTEPDSSWTRAAESIGLGVARDVDDGCRDLAKYWQTDRTS